jgi:chloramphenicol 3-O phosphotransferase
LSQGQIIILNGAPRSGKSSIVAVIQETFPGCWINFGVDASLKAMTPAHLRPGIGLRPGGERPDLEPLVPVLYAALYESIAAHSRLGLNVVAEFGHHDRYTRPLGILPDCARRLVGLPVIFVGVRCAIETIMARRRAATAHGEHEYLATGPGEPVPEPVLAWQTAVHDPGLYDMEVDTTATSPEACAGAIRQKIEAGPSSPNAFERLAKM